MFKAIVINKNDDGKTDASLAQLSSSDLPEGNVTVSVEYSTVNYKDGLVLNGLGNLVRNYPHVPGVDFAGTVLESADERYTAGDKVVLTGWRVGEVHWGGYSEQARVNGDWLVPLPDSLTTRAAMIVGTAGMAAVLGIMALEDKGLRPDQGPVLVTGAAGGVGSIASALLAAAGYEVEGSTGRESSHEHLQSLGVNKIVARADIAEANGKPLNSEYWSACVDSVGGSTLANVLTRIRHGGAVAAIGLAGGAALETTVIPFLLRGVSLLGIDSVMCPLETRKQAWQRVAQDLPLSMLDDMSHTIELEDVVDCGKRILEGQVQGRTLVKVSN